MSVLKLEDLRGVGGVLCHGCFDFLHIGHKRYFERSARYGPLVVTVTADEFVNKGPTRPYFNHHLRAEMIDALKCVKYVAVNFSPHADVPISVIRPDYYCKGEEYQSKVDLALEEEIKTVQNYGGKVIFIPDERKRWSSTDILKEWNGT